MLGFSDCRAISEMLWNYTAHKLSEPDIERVEQHLIHCGACRAEADAYRQTVDALASIRQNPIPDSRRGWHELRATLSAPERRPAPARLWSLPTLTWGLAAVSAAVALALLIPAGSSVGNSGAGGAPQVAQAAAGAQSPRTAMAARDVESADPGIDPDELSAFANSPESHTRSASRTSARIRPLRPSLRRPLQLASIGPSAVRRHFGGVAVRTRTSRRYDRSHTDGWSASNGSDNGDYVMTPVSAVSESDASEDYVMGGVMMSARSSEAEVAHGW